MSTKYSVAPGFFSSSKAAAEWKVKEACAYVSDAKLEHWAADPNCVEMEICARLLSERLASQEKAEAARQALLARKREGLQADPFDPRTEVSADAKHIAGRIVTHLWILFVLLPFIIGLLWAMLK